MVAVLVPEMSERGMRERGGEGDDDSRDGDGDGDVARAVDVTRAFFKGRRALAACLSRPSRAAARVERVGPADTHTTWQ